MFNFFLNLSSLYYTLIKYKIKYIFNIILNDQIYLFK